MKQNLRRFFFSLLTLIVLAGAYFLHGPSSAESSQTLVVKTENGPVTFFVEMADTEESMMHGLMFREHLEMTHGMLFDFKTEQDIAMWMKNTLIPLDMLFVNRNGVITRITENAVPHSLELIPSGGPVRAVVELAGGAVKQYDIAVGNRVLHPIFP